jgi:1-acyl-sn-glycerol-3-phosphate acyltransferase
VSLLRAGLNSVMVAVLTVIGSMMALAIRVFDSSGDRVVDLARAWSRWVTTLAGVRIAVDCRTRLVDGQPYVFMANHASAVDIWAVFVGIPRRIRMIAKRQLGQIPLFGWAMWAGRFIFIDRQNAVSARRSIEEARRRIQGGDSVLLFPEGTRTPDGSLGPFKKGGFHLAMEAGVPIVPVALTGTFASMPKGSFLLRPGTVQVIIGEPISTKGLSESDRGQLLDRVRGEIAAMLAT